MNIGLWGDSPRKRLISRISSMSSVDAGSAPKCAQPETVVWQGFCAKKVYHGGDICIVRHRTACAAV